MMTKQSKAARLRTVDLFSGCGGMSRGFENAGFDIVAAYDSWELATEVYRKNFNHSVHPFDLTNLAKAVEHISTYKPNIIIGGPPCQDFSIAGKRKEAARANLTVQFAKIVTTIRPEVAIMENVYSIEKSLSLRDAKKIFIDAGYSLTTRVIDASLTGVPQRRKRYFLIAGRDLPDDAFAACLDDNLGEKSMTVHDYFGDAIDTDYYYAHPRSYQRRAVFSIYEPSSTIRRVNRPIPKTYQKHPADKVDISPAVRPLTTAERAAIQTFPSDYQFSGSNSQREHLIANAVPVKLAEYVATQIATVLTSNLATHIQGNLPLKQ
jgi:DNA (cytosine-5)-methyltransferase 1